MTSLLHVKLSKQKDRLRVEARPDPRLGGRITIHCHDKEMEIGIYNPAGK